MLLYSYVTILLCLAGACCEIEHPQHVYIRICVYMHTCIHVCTYVSRYTHIYVASSSSRSAARRFFVFCVCVSCCCFLLLVDWRPSWVSLYEGVLSRRRPPPLREGGNHGWTAALCGRRLRRGCTSGGPPFFCLVLGFTLSPLL